METIRREDSDCVRSFARQHFVEVGIDLRTARVVRPQRTCHAVGLLRGAALDRDDLRVGDTFESGNMRALGNRTGTRNRNFDHRGRLRIGPVESSIHWMYGGEPRSACNDRTSGTS